jgi:ribosome-binding factor A
MNSIRSRKVAELLRKEIALILEREVKDPRVEGTVLTYVRLSGDLSEASVFFSSYNKDRLKIIETGLSATAGFIRHTLKSRVRMKRIPSITFFRDDTEEIAARTDRLLDQIKAEQTGEETSHCGLAPQSNSN